MGKMKKEEKHKIFESLNKLFIRVIIRDFNLL